jgi:hypothetical protein
MGIKSESQIKRRPSKGSMALEVEESRGGMSMNIVLEAALLSDGCHMDQ